MATDTDPITKIGTEVVGVRAISGYLHAAEPGTIILRQLYPGRPANIGVIASATGQVTIHPSHHGEWTEHDRAALAAFFLPRYLERGHG
ncbi:hypothetical protein LO763_07945 [Glycomyces sp. A-F 0318]|uniref:hypothetical protein n=1 Tax=Glycomyces amatae TaxID=2881355 RepID=UPI001E494892|nr:hypothetical protein [Glycomyces amatae]MCD0443559.1 hypothetical protein [Glycomyces amatae]